MSRRRRCEAIRDRRRRRRGTLDRERAPHRNARPGRLDLPVLRPGSLSGRNQHHPRRQPEPHQRFHGPVLDRTRGLHGDRRLRVGLRHADVRRPDSRRTDLPPRDGPRQCPFAHRARGRRFPGGVRGIPRGRAVAAPARRLPRDRHARVRRDHPRLHPEHRRGGRRARALGDPEARELLLDLSVRGDHDPRRSRGSCAPRSDAH